MATNMLVRRLAGLALSQPPSRSLLPATSMCTSGVLTTRCISSASLPTFGDGQPNSAYPAGVIMTSTNRFFSSSQNAKKKSKSGGPAVVTGEDGRQYAVVDTSRRKLKPSIVRRRLERMKIYEGKERDIRYSPFRLGLICRLVAGLPLLDALEQLEFCTKDKAPLVQKVLKRTSNLADIRDGLQMSQLEVAECFATHGKHVKGIRFMGRGRMGRTKKRYSHLRVVLREIDFPLRIYQAPTINQKRKWIERQLQAEKDADTAREEREELARLEQQAAEKEAN